MSRTLICLVATLILNASALTRPREVPWSSETFGPDGPWPAVQVQIGTGHGGDEMCLFPGSTWETWLMNNESVWDLKPSKGQYNHNETGSSGGISYDSELKDFMLGVELNGTNPMRWADDVELDGETVRNASLALLDWKGSQMIKYPGGQKIPITIGCLSLGGEGSTNETFHVGGGIPTLNASLLPGYLWEHGSTPSNSFGMHIGSAQPQTPGSLWFGGYDKNRIVGDLLNMTGSFRDGITLRDISIDVIGSNSPFDFKTKDGLLTNSSGSGIKVLIDGCSPYLTLPRETCDNLAAELPVHFNDSLGLYVWDTTSEKYKEIIPSATALSFSFMSDLNTNLVKIRVPFMHLNLTLTEPLVETPTKYFPCHVNNLGQYVLGRAFLQDSFIGGNWDPDINVWWLAQAPGPVIQDSASVITIAQTDAIIQKGGNDWEASWKGVWNDEAVATDTPTNNTANSPSGLPTAAKAGIGAGLGIAALALLFAIIFFLRRRNHRRDLAVRAQTQQSTTETPENRIEPPNNETLYEPPKELPNNIPTQALQTLYEPPKELPNNIPIQVLQDSYSRHRRYELPT